MDDQLNLEAYYDGVLQEAALHLTNKYDAKPSEHPKLKEADYRAVYQLNLPGLEVAVVIGFSYQFPDAFPIVIIPEPYFSKLYPIPHLSANQVLCTFDENEAHPNAQQAMAVIDATIERAEQLIQMGITKTNKADYIDEFTSYWAQDVQGEYLSLVDLGDDPKEVELIYFQHEVWGESALLADSKLNGERWLLQAGAKLLQKHKRVLYLPLSSIGLPPFPTKNREIINTIQQYSPQGMRPFLDFLNKYPRPSSIVFSIPDKNGRVLGVWEHGVTKQLQSNAYRSKKRVVSSLKGFRPGKRNAWLELKRDFSKLELKKYSVIRIDKQRLFERGGDGTSIEGRVGIIGCGSIGSHIAQALLEVGLGNLLLVDPDMLSFENIARHVCGAADVGKKKVDALKQTFTSRFPHSEITIYANEILQTLISYETVLDRCDFTVVATGHLSTELRLNRMLQHRQIQKPLLYVWVEPYLAGAHAVWVDPANNGSLELLFDHNHRYINQVLDQPGQYSKRESGCQSTFVPYGLLEVKRFINDLMFVITDILSGNIHYNFMYTWLGNLSEQRKNKRKLSSKWAGADNYTFRMQSI